MLCFHPKSNGLCEPGESWISTYEVLSRSRTRVIEKTEDERSEVVRRLFYLITAAAEDAAELAMRGQSATMPHSARIETAARLRASGEMMEIVASAIQLI